VARARARALDRPGLDLAAFELEEALGRGGDDGRFAVVEQGRERGGVAAAQAAVKCQDIEALGQLGAKALADVGLEDVAGQDVLDRARDDGFVVRASEVGLDGGLARDRLGWGLGDAGEELAELIQPRTLTGHAGVRRGLGITAGEEEGATGSVVEGKDHVVEAHGEVGEGHVVGGGIGQPLEMVAEIVAEIADRTALERRELGAGFQREGAQQALEHGEGVTGEGALAQRDPAVLAGEEEERVGAQIAEAAQPRVGAGALQ
jgi:hypothetical protein